MNETLLHTVTICDESGAPIRLDYFLLSAYNGVMEQYGTAVVLHKGEVCEQCSVANITPLAGKMIRMIETLARNTVTAVSLREVLQDIL